MDSITQDIHSDMRFVAQMPCAARFSRMRIRIAFLLLVPGRGRCFNKRGINDRTAFQDQSALRQQFHNLSKQFLLDSVTSQNTPKASQRFTIRHLIAGINAAELRKRAAVYDLRHSPRVREVIQILNQIDPPHPFQFVGLVAVLFFVVVRLYNAYPFPHGTIRSISAKKSRLFVRNCDNSSLKAARLSCLSIPLFYHTWQHFALCGVTITSFYPNP